jgi:hypothetical protein
VKKCHGILKITDDRIVELPIDDVPASSRTGQYFAEDVVVGRILVQIPTKRESWMTNYLKIKNRGNPQLYTETRVQL